MVTLNQYFKTQRKKIDKRLDELLPSIGTHPKVLHQAMRYSVFSAGKRIRPILLITSCEACGVKPDKALPVACAIELIHTWTLIHDDLPAMDDDDMRRGHPACHKQFGEANAILAGTALMSLAFDILGSIKPPSCALKLIRGVAQAIGSTGVMAGQAVDKLHESKEVALPMLDYISIHKTAYLIKTSCWAGGIVAHASADRLRHLTKYGEYIGLAFQVVDDTLDGDGYRRIMSVGETRSLAERLYAKSLRESQAFKNKGKRLSEIAEFIVRRKK